MRNLTKRQIDAVDIAYGFAFWLVTVICLLLVIATIAPAKAEPGDAPRPSVRLEWINPTNDNADVICVYACTNLNTVGWVAGPYPRTYTNVPTSGIGWTKLATVPGTNTTWGMTNIPAGWIGSWQVYFVVTASNVWGESDFSNVAWSPPLPQATNRSLRIRGD